MEHKKRNGNYQYQEQAQTGKQTVFGALILVRSLAKLHTQQTD